MRDLMIDVFVFHNANKKLTDITPDEIIDTVCDYLQIERSKILSLRNRKHELVQARYFCYSLLKDLLKLTLMEIGAIMGGYDHTTVMHGIRRLQDYRDCDPTMEAKYTSVKVRIKRLKQMQAI